MEIQHTQGEWKADRLSNNHGDITLAGAIEIHNDKKALAFVQDHGNPYNNEEEEANARLIASAPELLEALEKATNIINVMIQDSNKPESVKAEIRIHRNKYRALIKKATE